MYDRLGFDEIPHVYADRYESYKEFFPATNLTQSKRYTSPIERNNGRQRHWLAAFRRRSIVVYTFQFANIYWIASKMDSNFCFKAPIFFFK